MVINRSDMKRKRRDGCASPAIEESPKRTKVHAQRKFAQGSNVNSPVLTPVPDNEKEEINVMPEPVELLPIKRPNTEDFLTFLCFRGTPILPPSLNFFNTASIVDTNGQVHEIKSESPKNGPIDTSQISKSGSGSADRPFIAFGVRKRADPIVIGRQMDKKRRHALALQALRRKYQEQRMAKIRAVTISKLSERVTNKTLIRSNSVSKTESTVTKKTQAVQKTNTKISVMATKHVKVTTQTVKTTLRPQIKPKMCLRSFRGRFVQKELQFRNVKKTNLSSKKITKKIVKTSDDIESEFSSDDEAASESSTDDEVVPEAVLPKVAKKSAPGPKKPSEMNFRITRSNKFVTSKITARRQQIKQLILTTPKTLVKPRTLRSHKAQGGDSPKSRFEAQQRLLQTRKHKDITSDKVVGKKGTPLKEVAAKNDTIAKAGKEGTASKKITDVKSPENMKKTTPTSSNKVKLVKTDKGEAKIIEALKRKEQERIKLSPTTTKSPEIKSKAKTSPVLKKEAIKQTPTAKKEAVKSINKTLDGVIDKSREDASRNVKKEVKSPEPEQKTSQRPTRKSKEAAAIYMEILSHKLVNDSKIDDDNVSIDSFPELPNVKKTEQRENELKAKARKSDSDSNEKKVPIEGKNLRSVDKRKNKSEERDLLDVKDIKVKEAQIPKRESSIEAKKSKPEEICDRKTRSSNQGLPTKEIKEVSEVKKVAKEGNRRKVTAKQDNHESDQEDETAKHKSKDPPKKQEVGAVTRSNKIASTSNAKKDVVAEANEDKCKTKEDEVTNNRRQTRNSAQLVRTIDVESDDSDESFRVDVKIPRKKQNTRSKVVGKNYRSDSSDSFDEILRATSSPTYSKDSDSGSESDDSLTSNNAVKINRNPPSKRFTKTRSQQKSERSFSDSDEEPLSKLIEGSKKDDSVSAKPKRECAKRPQNYLPMFSSSDEEERFFCGFQGKQSPKPEAKADEVVVVPIISDLSFKDIGRRFGKGKVNMSTEQIEKWLKDSAMAGSSNISKENDSMLKFGEKIPTETSLKNVTSIDTQRLKSMLLFSDTTPTKIDSSPDKDSIKNAVMTKPVVIDRKLVFRKVKVATPQTPSVVAFSASNESSVYAFGEDTDNLTKTPFRRPSRRPSSTATSRSEDDLSKCEEQQAQMKITEFRMPLVKQDPPNRIVAQKELDDLGDDSADDLGGQKKAMVPPPVRSIPKVAGDDFRYKVPSSPSASSSSSAKLYNLQKSRMIPSVAPIIPDVSPISMADFPVNSPNLVEAPTFYPSEREFQDPIEYIEKLRARAEQFGICRIVPPTTFKPECKVTDDMRFTAYNQYVHKMLYRWGPNFKELMAIKKYLSTQNISLKHPPWIGGMEIDLPRLYQTVQSLGGLKEVIEKKKWPRVSDAMKIPKSAQDRVTKLDDIYCKYLLPYDTLSPAEREKLFDEVETEWAKRESKSLLKMQQSVEDQDEESESASDDEAEECIVKGRNMALNAFYRIARNTMSMFCRTTEPLAHEVEQEFWRHVTVRQNHICVHSGSIDSGNWGYGFAVSKNSPFARHAWNLKVLTNNSGSVLRSLGPIMGVTVPTLHVGMIFSSCCWYRDPHSLPWIEYLHTGGNKIWYGIPDSASASFQTALKKIVPNYCHNKTLWLPSDTVMVPPSLLVQNGVSLCRIVQEPGQFIVVFPKAFTSSLSTGYVVSESVYFAPPYWLTSARSFFDDLRNSCEASMFSLDRLLLSIVGDSRSSVDVLRQILPAVDDLCTKELIKRAKIKQLQVDTSERLPLPEAPNAKKRKKLQEDDDDYECEICRMNLFVTMIETEDDGYFCLDHGIEQLEKKTFLAKNCKLLYTYDDKELTEIVGRIHTAIESKLQKKLPNKFAGMPTLLNK